MKLAIKNVGKTFTTKQQTFKALQDVSLDVQPGEFVCLVGPSGCGKTTILNLIAGLDKPTEGTVDVKGKIGLMFQEAGLFPWLTVEQNIEFGLKMQNFPKAERMKKVQKFISMVHLDGFEKNYPHEISGGMKQRTALARTLIIDPDILLMDEPFAALDAQTREHLYKELQEIWQLTKKTIVFITHDIREAVCLGDRVMVMASKPGRIKKALNIPFAYPRDINDIEVLKVTKEIRSELQATP